MKNFKKIKRYDIISFVWNNMLDEAISIIDILYSEHDFLRASVGCWLVLLTFLFFSQDTNNMSFPYTVPAA